MAGTDVVCVLSLRDGCVISCNMLFRRRQSVAGAAERDLQAVWRDLKLYLLIVGDILREPGGFLQYAADEAMRQRVSEVVVWKDGGILACNVSRDSHVCL